MNPTKPVISDTHLDEAAGWIYLTRDIHNIMKPKYFTIVIRADDEAAARSLIPGEYVGRNQITACSLGDAIALNEEFKKLIPEDKEAELSVAEMANIAAFISRS